MRSSDDDTNPPLADKMKNHVPDIAWAIVHQKDNIFVSKLLEISSLVQVRSEHHVDIFRENLCIDGRFCTIVQNEIGAEPDTVFFNRSRKVREPCDVTIYGVKLSPAADTHGIRNTCFNPVSTF
jgi:hypothetical protein